MGHLVDKSVNPNFCQILAISDEHTDLMLWLHKDGGMYFFLFGKLSQYLAEEIHTRRRRLPTEENREEFKLGFHVCLISSLESLSAYIEFSFSMIRAPNWLLAQSPPSLCELTFSFQGVVTG